VAKEAADGEIETLAFDRVAGGRVLGPRGIIEAAGRERRNQSHANDVYEFAHSLLSHCPAPQRGSVTTSISAGCPLLTKATARSSAGPRSFGSVIGPSPWTPKPRATVA